MTSSNKKYPKGSAKLLRRALGIWVFGVSLTLFASQSAYAQGRGAVLRKLPVLQHMGIVPVQWRDGEIQGTPPAYITATEAEFPRVVRESRRFRVIEDELVRGLWNDPKGRSELVSQYQMQALVSLSMAVEADTVRATVRILSPQLETFLQESETFGAQTFRLMDQPTIGEKLRALVFRVFNRIPVDVYVTSIQGKYVTLSGGEEQGVQVGDQVDLTRAFITARHPANGTWVKFTAKKLGKARVIDVKNYAAVAEIVALTHDGAVEIGDGAKVLGIESRAKFARAHQKQNFDRQVDNGPVIVPSIGEGERSKSPSQRSQRIAVAPNPSPVPSADWNQPQPSDAPLGDASAAEVPPAHQEAMANGGGSKLFGFERRRILAGPNLWKANGDAAAAAKFPFWLVSYASMDLIGRPVAKNIWLAGNGSFGLGQTGAGSFLGYGLNGRGYFEGIVDRGPGAILGAWRAGGGLFFDGMRVNKESFGGMDIIRVGALGGVRGRMPGEGLGLNWDAELRVYPLVIGRVGTNGTLSGVKSAMGWDLLTLAILDEKSSPNWGGYLWGGGLGYGSQALKGADEGATLNSLKLLLVLEK